MKITMPIFTYGKWKEPYEEIRFQEEAKKMGIQLKKKVVKEGDEPDFSKDEVLFPRVQLLDHLKTRLGSLKRYKGLTMNTYESIVVTKDKVLSFEVFQKARLKRPRSASITDGTQLSQAAKKVGGYPLILKNPHGSYGHGVILAESDRSARSIVDQLFEPWGNCKQILVQEFIEEAHGADYRLFVIGDKVHATIKRTALGKEFRSNVSLGAKSKAVKPTPAQEKLAIKAVKALKLDYAGVDLIESKWGPLLIEVNANPGFEAVESATGVNIAGLLLETLVKKACNPTKIL